MSPEEIRVEAKSVLRDVLTQLDLDAMSDALSALGVKSAMDIPATDHATWMAYTDDYQRRFNERKKRLVDGLVKMSGEGGDK